MSDDYTPTKPVYCAWCNLHAVGHARVESGYGPGQPSCGQHGVEYEPDETLFNRWMTKIQEVAWDEGRLNGVRQVRMEYENNFIGDWTDENPYRRSSAR